MGRISVYIISVIFALSSFTFQAIGQDTVLFPMKIRIGLEAAGSAKYFYEKDRAALEGYISADLNEKYSLVFIAGHSDYSYARYRDSTFLMYDYRTKGFFIRTGIDINLLKPEKSQGKYSVGIGLRYGLSHFNYEIPVITHENYWGKYQTSVSSADAWAHFIEISPGVRAEITKNFSMGWTVSIRKMIYSGSGEHLKPIYLPGYGNGAKSFSSGFSYFFIWSIPFKTKKIIIQPKVEEEEEPDQEKNPGNSTGGNIRQ